MLTFERLTASAGSGKTHALTSRYLELLAQAGPPAARCSLDAGADFAWPDVVAMTFTNKAAAEMQARVLESLKGRALGLPGGPGGQLSPEAAETLLDRLLRRPQFMNVRTIDSLLARLVQAFAPELGLPPRVEASFDMEAVFGPLYDSLLAVAEETDGPERRLLAQAGRNLLVMETRRGFWPARGVRDILSKVLAMRLAAQDADPYFCDEDLLQDHLRAELAELQTRMLELRDALEDQQLKADQRFVKALENCLRLGPADQPGFSAYFARPRLDDCLVKASPPCDDDAREAFAAAAAALRAYCSLWGACRGALVLAPFVQLAELLLANLRQAPTALAAGWPAQARLILERPCGAAEAFCRLGFAVRHLLVDEFQDTSREQWRALRPLAQECLAAGGTLLAVGDVKQAIYAWRGGDSRLFMELPDDPDLKPFAVCNSLDTNWRSFRCVVDFNNDFFGPLAKPDEALKTAAILLPDAKCPEDVRRNLAQDIATAFADSVQQVAPRHAATGGQVRIHRLTSPDDEDFGNLLRPALLATLSGVDPGRAAVLVRTNEQAATVASWLLQAGLPVLTENSLEMAAHPLVRQLVALLAFLDYPADDVALLTLLRGRELLADEVDLSQEELAQWLAAQPGPGLWRRLRQEKPLAAGPLEDLLGLAGLQRPYDLVTLALGRLGVLRRRPQDGPFARRFLELVHRAEERGCGTLAGFLDLWRQNGAGERLPMPESADAVRVLTIHKAKGLQFPVVAVPLFPQTGRSGRELREFGDQPRLLTWLRKEMGPPYHARRAEMVQEQLNLLYVACTRPVEELHLFLPPGGDLGKLVEDRLRAMEQDESAPVLQWGQARREALQPAAPCPEPQPAPTPRNSLHWLPRLKVLRNFRPAEELAGRAEADRGVLYHAALERLALSGGRNMDAAVATALDAFPPPLARRPALADELRAGLSWVLSRPELAEPLANGRPEVRLLDAAGNVLRLDLLHVCQDEALVVDYKTGQQDPEAHAAQLRRYMALAAQALALPARGLLVYVDLRRTAEVRP